MPVLKYVNRRWRIVAMLLRMLPERLYNTIPYFAAVRKIGSDDAIGVRNR